MVEIQIDENPGCIFPDITFNCIHCSKPITRTVNLNDMCSLITCVHCGRTFANNGVLVKDVKKRIFKHVKS